MPSFLVLEEKESEINQARDDNEIKLKEAIEESRKTFELTKEEKVNEEVSKFKNDHKRELREKEKLLNDFVTKFNSKQDSWKLEKRVIYFKKITMEYYFSLYI